MDTGKGKGEEEEPTTKSATFIGKTNQTLENSCAAAGGRREKSKVATNGMTYADWLTKAIQSGQECKLTLAEIYDWMVANVPGLSGQRYLHSSKGWKNAVRHTLSVNPRFCKIARPGRPSFWTVTPTKPNTPSTLKLDHTEVKCERKRRTCSSPCLLAQSPKRSRTLSTTDSMDTASPSTTVITPPAISPHHSKSADSTPSIAASYLIDYYQIPLALAAVAASARTIYKPRPTYDFRPSPTSAFDSFRPIREATG